MPTSGAVMAKPTSFGETEAEVRAALEQATPNVLRMALYQATRDPELAAMRVDKQPFWGGAFQVAMLAEEHVATVREKAWQFLRNGTAHDIAPDPSEAELRAMMDLLNGEPISDFSYGMGRGDLVKDEFPLGVEWSNEPPDAVKQAFQVVIVGAGLAGMAAAIQLRKLGIPYVVIERNSGVGGTWRVNDYPEARVDIASHHYQYSFMKRYPWKHYFATQPELKEYAEAVATRYDLKRNIRFETELTGAKWDEGAAAWRLIVRGADGRDETLTANALISAAGLFNAPNMPDISGIESFKGKMFHTTQWDHGFDYAGKRAGLIGTGSTGCQLMPEIARKAAHLTVYQRSQQWVSAIEGYREPVSGEVQWLFDKFPNYWGWYSYFIFSINMGDPEGLQNFDPEWQKSGGLISKRNDNLREHNKSYILSKIGHDPELVRKLMPDFPPFAKRPVVDNGWFDALNRDNVDLVTEPIDRITPKGVLTRDGQEREFDLIILGAGFKVERYLWPVHYEGRDGVTLERAWDCDGARAYLGTTVPGFPNLFIIYGPNGQARAGGLIKWLEIWSRYAVASVVKLIESGRRIMDVKRDVFDDYNARMDEAMKQCVWYHAESYYVNDKGRQGVNMPWKPAQYYEWIREPKLDEYRLD